MDLRALVGSGDRIGLFTLNTWLGALIGIVLYIGSRIFAPAEEASLSETFGAQWDAYCSTVKMPWL